MMVETRLKMLILMLRFFAVFLLTKAAVFQSCTGSLFYEIVPNVNGTVSCGTKYYIDETSIDGYLSRTGLFRSSTKIGSEIFLH